jgi:hypothetical protein
MSGALYRAGSRHVCRALLAAASTLDRQLLRAGRSEFDTPPSTGGRARAGWGGMAAAQAVGVQRMLTDWLPLLLVGLYATLTMAVLGSGGSVTMAVGRFVVGGFLSLVAALRRGLAGPRQWAAEGVADGI